MLVKALKEIKKSNLASLAKEMCSSFEAAQLPIARKGLMKYVPLKKVYEMPLIACQKSNDVSDRKGLYFYNGFLQSHDGIDKQLEIHSFDEAVNIYPLELADVFSKI